MQSYIDAGYTIITGLNSLILTFDHGPIGMAPLFNHGHADALSITLSVNSRALLVDPGTYCYNGAPEYRRYFRGTRAHNTVTVDGEDQAVQETGFIWSQPFSAILARCCEVDDGLIVECCHDGYLRLKNPVRHHRKVWFWGGKNILIRDTFFGKGTHDFELNYHIHPNADVALINGWWCIEEGEEAIFVQLLKEDKLTFIVGQEDPPFGWFSPAYGVKQKSAVLSCLKRMDVRDAAFLTAICVESPIDNKLLQEKAALI